MVNTMEQFYLVTGHERPPLTNPLMLELTLKEPSIFIHDSFFIPSLKKASFIVDSSRQTSERLFWIGCTNSVENNVLVSCRGVPSGVAKTCNRKIITDCSKGNILYHNLAVKHYSPIPFTTI
jgi:hypothetical protein